MRPLVGLPEHHVEEARLTGPKRFERRLHDGCVEDDAVPVRWKVCGEVVDLALAIG